MNDQKINAMILDFNSEHCPIPEAKVAIKSYALYAKYSKLARFAIARFLQGRYRNAVDVEQLVNDTMLDLIIRVVTENETERDIGDFGYLCIFIARCRVIGAIRRIDRRKRIDPAKIRSIESSRVEVSNTHSASPSDQTEANDLQDAVLRCLDGKQQEIVQLRLAGFTADEIAVKQHVSSKTIQRRQFVIAELVRSSIPEITPATKNQKPKTNHQSPITNHQSLSRPNRSRPKRIDWYD